MYKTKNEFLTNLEKELTRFGVVDKSEIIADFEQHFADSQAQGLSEAEICEKLGAISEIAKQYAEEEIFPIVAVEPNAGADDPVRPKNTPPPPEGNTPPPEENTSSHSDYENSGIKINFGKNSNISGSGLITVLCIDIFVLSWAIPALFGVFVGLLAIPFTMIIGGIAAVIAGFIGNFSGFVTPFAALPTFFLGLMLFSLGGLLGVAGVQLIKLFIFIIKSIIDWHGNMIVGRPVFKKKEVSCPQAEEVSA
jgi:uncharacterized membrane protein